MTVAQLLLFFFVIVAFFFLKIDEAGFNAGYKIASSCVIFYQNLT